MYSIEPMNHSLANSWTQALKHLLSEKYHLEKNYCFMGFPDTQRTLEYLCVELNRHVLTINLFNSTGQWQAQGLDPYLIEEFFTPDTVRYGLEYPTASERYNEKTPGLTIKHGVMNRLHNHFERLQGTVWAPSNYFNHASDAVKYSIRQLNNICHEIEALVLSQRKKHTNLPWLRPSQITTWLQAPRLELTDDHRQLFLDNGYDRRFGHVYMHWAQIGKTYFEVFRDEGAPKLDAATCEAITSLKYFSGEFDIEWGRDVVANANYHWHDQEQAQFRSWLIDNGLNPLDPKLSLGYLPIGKVLLKQSFGTEDPYQIWNLLSNYLDIYSIEFDGVTAVYDYCWSDSDYEINQINLLKDQ